MTIFELNLSADVENNFRLISKLRNACHYRCNIEIYIEKLITEYTTDHGF